MEPYETLAKVADEQGRRQSWIAKHLDVSEATVSMWFAGKRRLPEARGVQLATLLGIDAALVAKRRQSPPVGAGGKR